MAKLNIKKAATDVAALTIGSVGAGFVQKYIPVENAMIKAAAPLALGVVLMGQKGMLSQIGAGMVARGGNDLARAFAPDVISGLENEINGIDEDDFNVLEGTDEDLNGVDEINGDDEDDE